jgi:mRNA interferase HigB
LYRFLRRWDDDTITRGVGETVRQLRRGKKHVRVSAAMDGTGLSYNAVSTFFIRCIEQHSRGRTCHRHWLKWLVVADVKQQILLAQRARQGPWCDTRALPALLDAAGQRVPVREVLADAEFASEANHEYIRQRWRARSIIPAKPPLDAWYRIAKKAEWRNLMEVRRELPTADAAGKFTVFNIKGNAYRPITEINYRTGRIFLRLVLTHAEYSKGAWKQ